jgi:hypothetical protein
MFGDEPALIGRGVESAMVARDRDRLNDLRAVSFADPHVVTLAELLTVSLADPTAVTFVDPSAVS